jgi:hypothetical protein
MRIFWITDAPHSLQNSEKISFYKSMGEFKLAGAGDRCCLAVPCRKRAKSAPPATNVAHPPKTKEARANHCSPDPLQLVREIGSATSHQKENAKVRSNTTATAIPEDLTNAIRQTHAIISPDPWPIEGRKTMRPKSRERI